MMRSGTRRSGAAGSGRAGPDRPDRLFRRIDLLERIRRQACGPGAAFWAGYRTRLEAAEPSEQLRLFLRVYWFIGRTSGSAFAALLGDDVRRLEAACRLPELARGPLHRRARHVLEDSGAVRWADKRDVYRAAATIVELHPAVFRGLRAGYHEVHGALDPAEALALLDGLRLPADTEGLARLRAVLQAGVRNHYDDPAGWKS